MKPVHNSSINNTLHWFACVGGGEDNYQVTQNTQEIHFDSNKCDFDNVGDDEGTNCRFEGLCMNLCVLFIVCIIILKEN